MSNLNFTSLFDKRDLPPGMEVFFYIKSKKVIVVIYFLCYIYNMNKQEIQNLIQHHKDQKETISNIFRDRIKELGNKKTAELLQIKQSTISLFAHKHRDFSIKMLEKIVEKIF